MPKRIFSYGDTAVMMNAMKFSYLTLLQVATVAAIIIFAIAQWNRMCTTPTPTDPVMGSHGWGVWFSDTIQVFEHEGKRICVPEGWASAGVMKRGPTWAQFPEGQSAILVRPEAFKTLDLSFENSAYDVTVVYPVEMTEEMLAPYVATITHAYERVGALYPNATEPHEHTVLVSVGLAGVAMDFESTLYPEPDQRLACLVAHMNTTVAKNCSLTLLRISTTAIGRTLLRTNSPNILFQLKIFRKWKRHGLSSIREA
jgi:hypothetical protein